MEVRPSHSWVALAAALLGLLGLTPGATAQDKYPSKPIRFIVPLPPGGSADVLARAIGQKLTENWGQQVVIDNRPGANSIIGTEATAKAPADGHTILMVYDAHTINPSLYKTLPYDTPKDFAPVSLVALGPHVLVVNPALPVKSVKDLVALAKAKPGQLNFSSAGKGSSQHMATELFRTMAGIDITHVPYKGGAPAMTAVIGGEVSMMMPSLVSALPHIRSGRLRALAVSSAKRSPSMPELPTIAEAGVPNYQFNFMLGIVAPAGTPRATVAKLSSEVVKILHMPDVQERFSDQAELVGSTPEEFSAAIEADIVKFSSLVKEIDLPQE